MPLWALLHSFSWYLLHGIWGKSKDGSPQFVLTLYFRDAPSNQEWRVTLLPSWLTCDLFWPTESNGSDAGQLLDLELEKLRGFCFCSFLEVSITELRQTNECQEARERLHGGKSRCRDVWVDHLGCSRTSPDLGGGGRSRLISDHSEGTHLLSGAQPATEWVRNNKSSSR